jgi:meiosis-specific protein HOP1
MANDKQAGAFDALSKKILASLQLSILLDKDNPANVVEAYTFTFEYTKKPSEERRELNGVTLTGPGGGQTTVRSMRNGLHGIVRGLIEFIKTLPDLPGLHVSCGGSTLTSLNLRQRLDI